jgi:hypothetical protein
VRTHVFTNHLDSDRDAKDDAFIYCETDNDRGHVYYGTFKTCTKGNGKTASGMSNVKTFERYGGTK